LRRALILPAAVTILLLGEAAYFEFLAWSLAQLYRGARNVAPADPLPDFVWYNAGVGAVLAVLAALYACGLIRVRRWFVIVAIFMLAYGFLSFRESFAGLTSWRRLLEADFLPLEAWSGIGFMLVGILELWRVVRRRGGA
jgi:hypothetical protein